MPHSFEDDIINLREKSSKEEEPEFVIQENNSSNNAGNENKTVKDNSELPSSPTPNDKVKVKFDKFVNLVANHAYEDLFEKYMDEDIIVSTDLLTDLANAYDEKPVSKTPFIFIGGIILGGLLFWIFFK